MGGDELIGIGRSFLQVGAGAVVATLWKVDGEASSALMTEFHRRLRSGLDGDEALALAMETVRGKAKWQHSHFWAPFTYIGGWGFARPLDTSGE
jgi:CHAT domain-containing protein